MKSSAQTRMLLLLVFLVLSIGSFAQVPDDGNGGPVLLVTNTANPFSKFPVEILRAEGWNAYKAIDISAVTATELNKYDVVIIGDIPVTSTQAALFDSWTTINGGTLIAFSPDPNLYSLLGITATPGTLADKYIKINNNLAPGAGLVTQTIQYHGVANLFTLNAGTVSIANIYSEDNTSTTYPAVTLRNVGTNGGQAIAFTYDLARSIVYTRQGNPAWSGQERDGEEPIRSDDLFYGASATDPQPDYVDMNKIAIPQADEQMRLLSNLMLMGSFDKKPLPRVWFLPKGKKAAVVMTGDDHAHGGTVGRFNQYMTLGPNTQADVDNWNAIRGTSYVFPGTLTNAETISFQNAGFEIGLHLNVNEGSNFTDAQWNSFWDNQMLSLRTELPNMANQVTHRTHFISWGSWAATAKLEAAKGVRMDVNYYYYPVNWVAGRPGMFTGSGMPMRFADLDGTLINNFQVPTFMPDESIYQDFSLHVNSLLDSALGTAGYYGVFCANMHTDFTASNDPGQMGSDQIIASAISRQVPVVSAKQMLDWIDGRNNAYFSNIVWSNNQLAFTLTADNRARNMKLMLPGNTGLSTFLSITKNGATVPFTMEIIKGVQYAFFDGSSGNYVASYSAIIPDIIPPAISNVQVSTTSLGTAFVTWTTDEMSDSRVDYGTDAATISSNQSDVTLTTSHSVKLIGLLPLTSYYFRVTSKDVSNNSGTEPATPAAPLQFNMPASTVCASDNLNAEFALGTPDANISILTTDNGELSLRQDLTEEQFTAASLPAGWNSGQWNAGGTVGFAGGFANVEGSKLYTTATYQAGSTAEFSARFTLSDFENIGYTQDNNFGSYWITIGRGSTGTATNVYVRTSDGIQVSLGSNLINAFHTYRIAWGQSNFTIYVDGDLKATVSKIIATPMNFIVSDYLADANSISVDFYKNITGGYAASGTYTSRVFSLGSTPGTTNIFWDASVPANTGLSISVRSGNSFTPDGTWSAFADVTNNQILSLPGINVQYKAILTSLTSANTSLLNDITFNCANPPTPAAPVISDIQSVPSMNGTSVITWTTDVLSDSRIDYGTTAASLSSTVNNLSQVTAHSITLTGLTPGIYYYRVTSKFGISLQTTSPAVPAAPLQFTIPINTICASDDLASDFALGTTGTNTAVTSTVNGEVALSQSFTEEAFDATSIPSGWNSQVWEPGGIVTFAGGIASLNATRLFTSQTFSPGTTVEFSARFTLSDFQNIGFANNENFDTYWATIGRGAEGSVTDIYFRTSDNVKISLGTGYLDAYHTYKITWSTTSFTVYVDGIQKATVNISLATPLIFVGSDLVNDANSLSLDYFRNLTAGYLSSGTYTSRIFSLGSYSGSTVVSWNESVPANTGLTVSVSSGNTATPDGSWSAFTQITNGQSVTPSGSFVQYQAVLTTSTSANTPLLNDIKFDCINQQIQPPPVISNVQAVPSLNGTSVITWTTDVASDSRIDYGTSAATLSTAVNDAALVTSHSITLTGLTLGTTYYYTVTSKYGTSLPTTSGSTGIAITIYGASSTATGDQYCSGRPITEWNISDHMDNRCSI